MAPQKLCVSCRLENKTVCHSPAPLSQYCSDFKLFPATMSGTNNQSDETRRTDSKMKDSTEWAFPGSNVPDIKLAEDAGDDLDVIGNDSGYYSSDGFLATPSVPYSPDTHENDVDERKTALGTDSSDTAASMQPNHGSVLDMIDIADARNRSSAPSLRYEPEEDDGAWPSLFDGEVTLPSPLESWAQSLHRHESLAYRLAVEPTPTKRRQH